MTSIDTPLRYPGGKSGLTNYLRLVLAANGLRGGHYVEPYCGGAGAAISLLRAEAVSHVHINDIDPSVYAFWRTVLVRSATLIDFVQSAKLTVDEWKRQRDIYQSNGGTSTARACAFFYLNRVNRSGILNAGLIGGLAQRGDWLMDARFNRDDLCARIAQIAAMKSDISVANEDALAFLKTRSKALPKKTLIYLDPPYFKKGQCLYRNSYGPDDHAAIASYLRRLKRRHWIASYDDAAEIRKLYSGLRQQRYTLSYSARKRAEGREVIIFGNAVSVPAVLRPMQINRSQVFAA